MKRPARPTPYWRYALNRRAAALGKAVGMILRAWPLGLILAAVCAIGYIKTHQPKPPPPPAPTAVARQLATLFRTEPAKWNRASDGLYIDNDRTLWVETYSGPEPARLEVLLDGGVIANFARADAQGEADRRLVRAAIDGWNAPKSVGAQERDKRTLDRLK